MTEFRGLTKNKCSKWKCGLRTLDKYLRPFIPVEKGNGEELEREAKVKIFKAKDLRYVARIPVKTHT